MLRWLVDFLGYGRHAVEAAADDEGPPDWLFGVEGDPNRQGRVISAGSGAWVQVDGDDYLLALLEASPLPTRPDGGTIVGVLDLTPRGMSLQQRVAVAEYVGLPAERIADPTRLEAMHSAFANTGAGLQCVDLAHGVWQLIWNARDAHALLGRRIPLRAIARSQASHSVVVGRLVREQDDARWRDDATVKLVIAGSTVLTWRSDDDEVALLHEWLAMAGVAVYAARHAEADRGSG